MTHLKVLQTIKRRKANWIGHILGNICLLKHVTEEKIKKDISGGKTRKKKQAATGRSCGTEDTVN